LIHLKFVSVFYKFTAPAISQKKARNYDLTNLVQNALR